MTNIMPIMHGTFLKAIPWEWIAPHEKQAQRNHDQSLSRLRERAGLAPREALAIIEDRSWSVHPGELACEKRLIGMFGGGGA